jgi:hypothetical protein
MDLEEVVSFIRPENVASQRVAKGLGMAPTDVIVRAGQGGGIDDAQAAGHAQMDNQRAGIGADLGIALSLRLAMQPVSFGELVGASGRLSVNATHSAPAVAVALLLERCALA